ncbi:hypothetical protein [Sulfitobacter sp.]|uniref:hypothetical protein n=1 Tax=Sulfitobacter sp. TaxID=1903071 RepID=UPI0032983B36
MTIDVVKQFEDVPAEYPAAPSGLSPAAAALDAAMIWQRIEAYTAWRFTLREVVWTLIGDGGDQFNPRLTPVVSREGHVWRQEAWVPVSLLEGPLGIILPSDGTFKITAQVGDGDMPAVFSEAFRRLAEYLAPGEKHPGASGFKTGLASIDIEETRSATWVAKAMQYSGAADLLRNYRRA